MERRRRNTRQRRRVTSLPFIPNRGLQVAYAKALRALVLPMVRDVRREVVALYRRYAQSVAIDAEDRTVAMDDMGDALASMLDGFQRRYEPEFAEKGRELAREMVYKQRENADRTFADRMKSLLPLGAFFLPGMEGETLGVANAERLIAAGTPIPPAPFSPGLAGGTMGAATPELREVIKASVIENVSLIKTIPAKYLDRVAGAATRAMLAGGEVKKLAETLKHYGEMSLNHATRIALDQTFKTFTAINIRKFQNAGIKKFEWLHTGGSVHPREYHLAKYPAGLNGGVFDLADPPVIDQRTGERGYPGQLPYCRCTMAAVVDLDMFG